MIAFCTKIGTLQNVNMLTLSKSGRSYIPEKPLSSDLRHLIIDKIVEVGGDTLTMIFPCRFVDIGNGLNVSSATVSKIWKNHCKTGSLSPFKHRGGNPSHLSNGDLELIGPLTKPGIFAFWRLKIIIFISVLTSRRYRTLLTPAIFLIVSSEKKPYIKAQWKKRAIQ